jgi:KipI family sensor histidine kinase inhibitor
MGSMAVLVEVTGSPAGFADGVQRLIDGGVLVGVVDVVPAATTVLVTFDLPPDLDDVRGALGSLAASVDRPRASETVEVPTRYDGEDLASVAEAAGMSIDDVVALHAAGEYTVSFCGFAPGFGYLDGLPAALQMPRRPTPRTRVPAGSVAIAAGYSAVYPRESPGGWHLIGRTSLVLFDALRDPPALLSPGFRVRFVPT